MSFAASHSRLPRARLLVLFAAPLAILGVAWGAPLALFTRKAPVPTVAAPLDGAQVYARNCAQCHGADGDGRGSTRVEPPARYFGRDKFKFATTANGIPCDDDLMRVMHRGIPGSAMPAFPICDDECRACIEHLRTLTRRGLFERRVEKAKRDDDDVEHEKFAKWAAEAGVPGERLAVPAFPHGTPERLAAGKAVYLKICASCHGADGRGNGDQVQEMIRDFELARKTPNDPAVKKLMEKLRKGDWLHADGTLNVPRDLTRGQYKGGDQLADLYARIMLGIPGTPMPSSSTQPAADIIDLVLYVRSLGQSP